MPLLIIAFGIILLAAAVRGRQKELVALLKNDLVGEDSFLLWIGVFTFIYIFGKVDPSGRVAKWLGILVIVSIMLTKGRGFFDQLESQLKQITSDKALSYSPKSLKTR